MWIVLTEQQRLVFERDGILKLDGAFDRRDAARMREVMWNELRRRHGIEQSDPSTWSVHPPTGMKSSKKSRAFTPILGPPVLDALDDLFGPGRWERPKTLGNVLITMPNATSWRVPHKIWHSDFEATAPTDRLFAVKLWALCNDVPPAGGARRNWPARTTCSAATSTATSTASTRPPSTASFVLTRG